MSSIADPPDTTSTCTEPHVDGCGGCVSNYEEPWHRVQVDDGCCCSYTCTDCGHHWTTNYGRCV